MRSRDHAPGRGDRGVSAVVFALMLTALLSMSAVAVDLGAAYTERRHDQNTADVAVMSGAVEAVLGGGVIDEVVVEVQDKVDTTLDKEVTDAEWLACEDAGHLEHTAASLGVDPKTECISFNAGFDQIRVKLPPQQALGVFGPALGFGTITTTAAATAQVEPSNDGGAPPFIAFENAKKGDFICLRTGGPEAAEPEDMFLGNGPGVDPSPSTVKDPCHSGNYGISSSTFGTVKPYAYKDGCSSPGNAEIRRAIAVGMDHLLGVFPGGFDTAADVHGTPNDGFDTRQRVDGGDSCTKAYPNTLQVDTGFTAQLLKCALLSPANDDLCVNDVPRLKQGAGHPSSYTVAGETFDNTPLWDFLRPAAELHAEGAPTECVIVAMAAQDTGGHTVEVDYFNLLNPTRVDDYKWFTDQYPSWRGQYWEEYDLFDWTDECLDAWQPGVDPATMQPRDPELFTGDIGRYPRFAFIPQVAESTITHSGDLVHIEGFLPVYLNRIYIPVSGTVTARNMCGPWDERVSVKYIVHDAGQPWGCGGANDNVARLSSLVLACGMVSDELCDKESELPHTSGLDPYDFRLVE